MDPQSDVYQRYYTAQSGGQFPAFHGARITQYGARLGDILGGIWRTVVQIALHGIGTFISSTRRAGETGFGNAGACSSWGAAAKSELIPTALNVLSKSAEAIENRIKTPRDGQAGRGNGRRKRKTKSKAKCGGGGKIGWKHYKRPRKSKLSGGQPENTLPFANFRFSFHLPLAISINPLAK